MSLPMLNPFFIIHKQIVGIVRAPELLRYRRSHIVYVSDIKMIDTKQVPVV